MEKLGVDVEVADPENGNKTASEALQRCPKCGSGLEKEVNVKKCPKCGTLPFE